MPPKTIYKLSKSVIENIETGIREKSQRSKIKKRNLPSCFTIEKIAQKGKKTIPMDGKRKTNSDQKDQRTG